MRAIELGPTYWPSYFYLAHTYGLIGRLDEAILAAMKANEFSGGNPPALGMLGRVYGSAGRTVEARRALEALEAQCLTNCLPPMSLAMVYRGLGDLARGLEWWTRGIDEQDQVLVISFKSEPSYDPIRPHPAYQALLRNMNLEPCGGVSPLRRPDRNLPWRAQSERKRFPVMDLGILAVLPAQQMFFM